MAGVSTRDTLHTYSLCKRNWYHHLRKRTFLKMTC